MNLRIARPEDAMGVARVHVRSWQVGYRDLLPAEYLNGLDASERARRYSFADPSADRPRTVVAAKDHDILGFATVARVSNPMHQIVGELCALYVDPDEWGRGIGSTLLSSAEELLVAMGSREALLWILSGNFRAERFYNKHGWIRDDVHRTQMVWGLSVAETSLRKVLR